MVTIQSCKLRSRSVVPSGTTQMGSRCSVSSFCAVILVSFLSLVSSVLDFSSLKTLPSARTTTTAFDRFSITVPSPLSLPDTKDDLVLLLGFVGASVETVGFLSLSVSCCRDNRIATSSLYRRNRNVVDAVAVSVGLFMIILWIRPYPRQMERGTIDFWDANPITKLTESLVFPQKMCTYELQVTSIPTYGTSGGLRGQISIKVLRKIEEQNSKESCFYNQQARALLTVRSVKPKI